MLFSKGKGWRYFEIFFWFSYNIFNNQLPPISEIIWLVILSLGLICKSKILGTSKSNPNTDFIFSSYPHFEFDDYGEYYAL